MSMPFLNDGVLLDAGECYVRFNMRKMGTGVYWMGDVRWKSPDGVLSTGIGPNSWDGVADSIELAVRALERGLGAEGVVISEQQRSACAALKIH